MWLYSTHLQKSMRNVIEHSKPKGTQLLKDKDGINFGWASIESLLEYDNRNLSMKTSLKNEAVYLNHWSKISSSLSKAFCEDKTLTKQYILLLSKLHLTNLEKL